jgi:hypothetical protein
MSTKYKHTAFEPPEEYVRDSKPYSPEAFAAEESQDQRLYITPKQMKAEMDKYYGPIEARAFEKGRLAGLAEAGNRSIDELREAAVQKVARVTGATERPKKTVAELAARAVQLREEAASRGESLTNVESCRAAFAEAGVPFQ